MTKDGIAQWCKGKLKSAIGFSLALGNKASSSINKAEKRLDEALDGVSRSVLAFLAFMTLVFAILVGLNVDFFPVKGWNSAPNLIFLAFVFFFGLVGVTPNTNSRFWSLFGAFVGLLMWFFSLFIS